MFLTIEGECSCPGLRTWFACHLIRAEFKPTESDVTFAAEFVGLPATIAQAVDVVTAEGRVVLSGIGSEPITTVSPGVFVRKEISLIGSYAFTKQMIERLMDLVSIALEESGFRCIPGDLSCLETVRFLQEESDKQKP